MAIVEEQRRAQTTTQRQHRAAAIAGAAAFAVVVLGFWVWWPVGIALGLIGGIVVTLRIGLLMQAAALQDSETPAPTRREQHSPTAWQPFDTL